MIKRRETHNHHAGEISFPGGAVEAQDSDIVATALREAYEEIGAPAESIDVLGLLTPLYIEPSDNLVQPVVGWLNALPNLKPQPAEVAQILSTPLTHFMRIETLRWQTLQQNGRTLTFPSYMLAEDYVWGATAMILSEMLSLICDLEQETTE